MKKLISFSILFFTLQTFGSFVEFIGTPTTQNVAGVPVKIYPQARVKQLDKSFVDVKLTGSGVRKVTVVFLPVSVYHVSSYVMYPDKLMLPKAMEGIKASPTRLLYITLLRSLTGQEIRDSLEEALEFNDVNFNHPAFNGLMENISNITTKAGETFVFGATPGVKDERVFFELPSKVLESEYRNISTDLWKIWFYKPLDNNMKDLLKALVGKKSNYLDFTEFDATSEGQFDSFSFETN